MADPSNRERRRQRLIGAAAGAAVALVGAGVAFALWGGGGDGPAAVVTVTSQSTTAREPLIVRSRTEGAIDTTDATGATTETASTPAPTRKPAEPAPRRAKPVVWIQAGHADPREPGYRDQTGAGTGPFGSEIGFTTNLAPKVIARLRRAGVDARSTAGMVEPLGAPGAAFVSLHHDSPGGAAAFGHAISGAGENYYRGEGSGDPSPTPYPDSAPHRPATTVSPRVERESQALASALDAAYRPIYSAANGAGGRYGGVQTRSGNPRMMRYYGFYRTNARARVIVEAGAAGADDRFMARTDLIADAVSRGIITHLKAEGSLR